MTYNSTFQDRAAQAADARKKALERYRARPPVDEQRAAERLAAGQERETARAEKAEAKSARSTGRSVFMARAYADVAPLRQARPNQRVRTLRPASHRPGADLGAGFAITRSPLDCDRR